MKTIVTLENKVDGKEVKPNTTCPHCKVKFWAHPAVIEFWCPSCGKSLWAVSGRSR